MQIHLYIQTATLRTQVENRLHLYNLATQISPPETPVKPGDIIITDDGSENTKNADKNRKASLGVLGKENLPEGTRIIRLGLDLTLPEDETLFHRLLTTPPTQQYPLILVASARGRSGATHLVTHPRITPTPRRLPQQPTGKGTLKIPLIRINLLDDPTFAARLTTPFTRILWDETISDPNFVSERFPAGELIIDTDIKHNPPWKLLPEILPRLAAIAPVVVDAGRLTAPLVTLAEETNAQLVIATRPGIFPRATVKATAQKWQLPTISHWKPLKNLLSQRPNL